MNKLLTYIFLVFVSFDLSGQNIINFHMKDGTVKRFIYENIDQLPPSGGDSISFEIDNSYFFVSSCEDSIQFNGSINYGSINDFEGHVYKTVQIGNQNWMAENLRTAYYSDGSPIQFSNDEWEWQSSNDGLYTWYNNDSSYECPYGKMYSYETTINNSNVCPTGWHVPSYTDWEELITFLGGTSVVGGLIKEQGFSHWLSPNQGADNSTGFTAIPAGYRILPGGIFAEMGAYGGWWSVDGADGFSTIFDCYYVTEDATNIYIDNLGYNDALPIRCIED